MLNLVILLYFHVVYKLQMYSNRNGKNIFPSVWRLPTHNININYSCLYTIWTIRKVNNLLFIDKVKYVLRIIILISYSFLESESEQHTDKKIVVILFSFSEKLLGKKEHNNNNNNIYYLY